MLDAVPRPSRRRRAMPRGLSLVCGLVLAAVIAWPAATCASPGRAQDAAPRTAGWLLGRLAAQARVEAQASTRAHRADDARTWNGWAGIYETLAKAPNAGKVTALAFTQAMVQANRSSVAVAQRFGATDAADLFRASSRFWGDLAAQLRKGGAPRITFPKQMLRPVPGLQDSPWASQPASPAVQKMLLCDGLASRVKTCKAQLALMRHEQTMGLADNGDQIVVEMTMCDRAQEQYVGSCMK